MVVGVLQAELSIPGAESLKDKRRVVRSLKDRLHREHQVSVAEIGALDRIGVAMIGVAVVGIDGKRLGEVLDTIEGKLRKLLDAEVAGVARRLIHGSPAEPAETEPVDGLETEMLARAAEDER